MKRMKRIDELCISPWPWVYDEKHPKIVWSNSSNIIVNSIRSSDALLIAAAPELYEALAAFVNWYDKNKPLPYDENGIQMIAHYANKTLAKASGERDVEK